MYTYASNKQESKSFAVANSLPRQRKASGGKVIRAAVIQRKYTEMNWGEEEIVKNVKATTMGAGIYAKAEAAARELGLALKVLVDDGTAVGFTAINGGLKLLMCVIPGKKCEGDATQILVQELGNAANKRQLDKVGSEENARKTKKDDYVKGIESLEYVGAVASYNVFEEAKAKGAEWTKEGSARWKKDEIKDLGTYLRYLSETKASKVYEDRWEKHNTYTYLLYKDGDYQLLGVNVKEKDSANIILVHKGKKVMEGTATGDFGAMRKYAKILFNAYVWKYTGEG